MTKFLKQSCLLEKYIIENGQPKTNIYGELQYEAPTKLRCRREMAHKDIQTTEGSIIRSTAVYYVDDSVPIMANYRLDGSVVVSVISYVNALGKLEGYEVYV